MSDISEHIAIIGMNCRFPQAANLDTFWENLSKGKESVRFFSDDELLEQGIPASLLNNPDYVKATAVLDNIDLFDADFFDMPPREAEITDPQHRLFLQCASEVLDHCAYDPYRYKGKIGVYAGSGLSSYLLYNLIPNRKLQQSVSNFQLLMGNNKDFMPTRVSYKLNLKGPSVNVSTACSTSLVAVHMACQSLLDYQCDMSLAGGVSIQVPQKQGYLYQKGDIASKDGHCRPFDRDASGTVSGNGVGVVMLKRLEDALNDGDNIHAVILGSAVNNDGADKVGYTAPSVNGQAEVIEEAQATAEVEADSISYIEAHGTATYLGDPIEIAALTQAFQQDSERKQFCALGSVKSNFGHLDEAAGIAGLIKTVLALKAKKIPPSLHYQQANTAIDFANSPFYVNKYLSDWSTHAGIPRRAGVSSFGIGGTNAHLILEEAPINPTTNRASRPWQLLTLSAKTPEALQQMRYDLADHLENHSAIDFADVAYTLQVGRRQFSHKYTLLCQQAKQAIKELKLPSIEGVIADENESTSTRYPICFMFSGQGNQYPNMGHDLYEGEAVFQQAFDQCCEGLKAHIDTDLRQYCYPDDYPDKNISAVEAAQALQQTAMAQPALFTIEYAMAQLWISWGIQPQAMIGHSIGEYVAACLAGVFSLADTLFIVAKRAQLMQELPKGCMLAVPLSAEKVQEQLPSTISIATINEPQRCVLAGDFKAIEQFEQQLEQQGIVGQRLQTSHAFHSAMMEPMLASFTQLFSQVSLHSPKIPYISNLTGTWITQQQATDPEYYAQHLRQTVRFSAGIETLSKANEYLYLEIGPGHSLNKAVSKQIAPHNKKQVLSSIRHPNIQQDDHAFLLKQLAQIWLLGTNIQDWSGFYADEQRRRVILPSYPFQPQRCWIDTEKSQTETPAVLPTAMSTSDESQHKIEVIKKKSSSKNIEDYFYQSQWLVAEENESMSPSPINGLNEDDDYLIFTHEDTFSALLMQRLALFNNKIIKVVAGSYYQRIEANSFRINPSVLSDYQMLVADLVKDGKLPQHVIHLWNIYSPSAQQKRAVKAEYWGYYSLLFLVQALTKHAVNTSRKQCITVISDQMQAVFEDDILVPEKAAILGLVKLIPKEYPQLDCFSIDLASVDLNNSDSEVDRDIDSDVDKILTELKYPSNERLVAYRNNQRYLQHFAPLLLTKRENQLKSHGVYLITGGFGSMGLAFSRYIAEKVPAKLVLIARSDVANQADNKQHIRLLENLGSEVLALQADVANASQMGTVFEKIQQRFGEINGVIHTAGILNAGLIHDKTEQQSQQGLAAKLSGTQILNTLLKDSQPDFFILCSSLASIQPIIGQATYAGANAFLDAFAYYNRSQNQLPTQVINWGVWQQLGLIEQANLSDKEKQALLDEIEVEGWSTIGVDLLDRFLCSAMNTQVLLYPHALADLTTINLALFDAVENKIIEQGFCHYISHLSPQSHWLLDEHRLMGKAILPGTAYLEMIRAAFTHYQNNSDKEKVLCIENVYFLSPLIVDDDETREVRVIFNPSNDITAPENNRLNVFIVSQIAENEWQQHVTAQVSYSNEPKEVLRQKNIADLELACDGEWIATQLNQALNTNTSNTPIKEECSEFERRLKSYGKRWMTLKWAKFKEDKGLALLALKEDYQHELADYPLHPALLDIATGFMYLKFGQGYLPFSYEAITVYATLTNQIYSYIEAQPSQNESQLKYHVWLLDSAGNVLVKIHHFILKKIETSSKTYQQLEIEQHVIAKDERNFYLEIAQTGALETLNFRPCLRRTPVENEVEIEVAYAGVNFIEVLTALGLLERRAVTDIQKFGLECSGKIVRVGTGVSTFKVGDEVMSFAHASLSQFTNSPISAVAHKPKKLSLASAATLPAAYATAYYALITMGRLQKGETVLIHSATGGVGMAAMDIARWVGAEIYATAGNSEKRQYLSDQGVQYVMDSRSLLFAEQIMEYTNGEGINVVLNALGGEFIPKSLSVLKRYGRFLELGKRDFMSNTALGLQPFENSLSFFALDVGTDLPDFKTLWQEVTEHLQQGHFNPLPYRSFSFTKVAQAFEYMAQARHIGKVILDLEITEKQHQWDQLFDSSDLSRQPSMQAQGLPLASILGIDEPLDDSVQSIDKAKNNNTNKQPKNVSGHDFTADHTNTEKILTQIWQNLLGVKVIALNDDFFALNGDSLLAAQVISRVHQKFAVSLPMSSLFDEPTIERLAKRIDHLQALKEQETLPTELSDDEEGGII